MREHSNIPSANSIVSIWLRPLYNILAEKYIFSKDFAIFSIKTENLLWLLFVSLVFIFINL